MPINIDSAQDRTGGEEDDDYIISDDDDIIGEAFGAMATRLARTQAASGLPPLTDSENSDDDEDDNNGNNEDDDDDDDFVPRHVHYGSPLASQLEPLSLPVSSSPRRALKRKATSSLSGKVSLQKRKL